MYMTASQKRTEMATQRAKVTCEDERLANFATDFHSKKVVGKAEWIFLPPAKPSRIVS